MYDHIRIPEKCFLLLLIPKYFKKKLLVTSINPATKKWANGNNRSEYLKYILSRSLCFKYINSIYSANCLHGYVDIQIIKPVRETTFAINQKLVKTFSLENKIKWTL